MMKIENMELANMLTTQLGVEDSQIAALVLYLIEVDVINKGQVNAWLDNNSVTVELK